MWHLVTVGQEDHKSIEDEEEDNAGEEGDVRPDLLAERFRDTERDTSDQVLVVGYHEQHCLLVALIW